MKYCDSSQSCHLFNEEFSEMSMEKMRFRDKSSNDFRLYFCKACTSSCASQRRHFQIDTPTCVRHIPDEIEPVCSCAASERDIKFFKVFPKKY